MTSKILTSVIQCTTRGDYVDGLNLIETYLEKNNLKQSVKIEVFYWKSYLLAQIELVKFKPYFGNPYDSNNFEIAFSIIRELEGRDLTLLKRSRLTLLKIRILRDLDRESELNGLFKDLMKVFEKNPSSQHGKEWTLYLREKAMNLAACGDIENVIRNLKKCIDLFLNAGNYENAAETLYFLVSPRYYFILREGFTDTDYEYFDKTLAILQKHQNYHYLAVIYVILLETYYSNNKFTRARQMQFEFEKIWLKFRGKIAISLHNRYLMYSGHLLYIEGSYEEANKIFKKELILYGENISTVMKGHILAYIGHNHLLNSNFEASSNHLNQAINISRKTNDVGLEIWILFYFILLSIEMAETDQAEQFFERMEIIYDSNENDHFRDTLYSLSKASLLKNSNRLRDKMFAQHLFEEVVNHNRPAFPDIYYYAVLNYIELLFLEFTSSKDMDILMEIKKKLYNLESYFEETRSIITEVNLVIFISRILFFELKFEESLQELNKIKLKVKKQDRIDQLTIIHKEEMFLKTEFAKIEGLVSKIKSPKVDKMLELSQMDELINQMIRYRYSRNQSEVSNYLTTALNFVKNDN